MPTHLLLVRHGQSVWNASGLWQGWADPPLSELGEIQAAEAAEALADTGLTGVASSDLRRAVSTAEVVADRLGLGPVMIEPDLREFDVGEWTGLTRPEIAARWPEELEAWNDTRLDGMPGGEKREEFRRRLVKGLVRLAGADRLGERALVVTHGGSLRVLEQEAGIEPRRAANLAGRWFSVEDGGRIAAGAHVTLSGPGETAPEATGGTTGTEADAIPPSY